MNPKVKLLLRAVCAYVVGFAAIGMMLFLPAGTLCYAGGWRLMALLFGPMLLLGVVMFFKAPDLLAKRLQNKEKQGAQRRVISLSALMFLAGFVLAGLDHRFGWSHLPPWLVWISCAVLVVSYALYAEVMRENAYLSRTIEVQQGQKVVDTGMYAVVRHPMYAVTLFLFLSMPLVLGSLVAFVVFLAYPALIVKRILNEEQVLAEGLPGYREYKQKVRWRLIPLVW